METWQEDSTFAWQYIRGVNPMVITVAKSIALLPKDLKLDAGGKARIAEIIGKSLMQFTHTFLTCDCLCNSPSNIGIIDQCWSIVLCQL